MAAANTGNNVGGEEVSSHPPESASEETCETVPPGIVPGAKASETSGAMHAKPEGEMQADGKFKMWFTGHKLLAGVVVGVLTVLLLGGMFAIGYVVGKPGGQHVQRLLQRQALPRDQVHPSLPLMPHQTRKGAMPGWFGVLGEYRDELESEIADELGISVDDLRDDIERGKAISDLAEERGISPEDLIKSLAAKIEEIADKLAADEKITAERAENIKSDAEDIASMMVYGGRRAGIYRGHRGGGGGFW
jgi:hypothetical protein